MEWFGGRRESLVMKQLRKHALKVYDTISELDQAVSFMCSEDKEGASDAIQRILLSEKAADNLEQSLTEELSKGDLDSRQREDLLHMVRRMDYSADWAKGSGMNLSLIVEAGVVVPVTLWEHFRGMTADLKKTAYHLKEAVENLGKDESGVIRNWKRVDELEHDIDEKYFQTKKEILFADMDSRAIFLLRDLIHGIENSADSCKDAADTMRIFIMAERYQR